MARNMAAVTVPISRAPQAVAVDADFDSNLLRNPNPHGMPFSGGTLLHSMKTLENIPKEEMFNIKWPWGKLASTNLDYPSADLREDKFVIGRHASCNLTVGQPSVSAMHCTIERVEDPKTEQVTFWLTDTSSNGTFVKGQRVGRGNKIEITNRTEIIIVPPADNRPKVSFYFFSFKSHPADEVAPEGQVTFVFTDVQSSTKLWETFPKKMDEALINHDEILRKRLKACRGYEVKTEGDAFMVTFSTPLDAIQWCLTVQESLLNHDWDPEFLKHESTAVEKDPQSGKAIFGGLRIRMGIHVGNPNCRRNPITGRMDYFGPVVNEAARVADSAHGGQVVCTKAVVDEIEKSADAIAERPALKGMTRVHLGQYPYKGIKNKLDVYQLSSPSILGRKHPDLRV